VPEPCKGKARQGRAVAATASQPVTHLQGRECPDGQRLLLEEGLAAGPDQAHLAVLAAKEKQGWLFRALHQHLCPLSFSLLLPVLLILPLAELIWLCF